MRSTACESWWPSEAMPCCKRGEPMTTEMQRYERAEGGAGAGSIAAEHQLVLSHGNGPQVGLLALQAAAYTEAEP